MASNENHDSVGNEQEPNLKNPDRRRVIGATAAAAALGTVGQAGSRAFAQASPPSNPSANTQTIPGFPASASGNPKNINQLKQVMKLVRDGIAATDIDGNKNTLNLGQYMKYFRIRPVSDPGNSTCACGCS
jgi:hypothetical protein